MRLMQNPDEAFDSNFSLGGSHLSAEEQVIVDRVESDLAERENQEREIIERVRRES